MQRTPDDLISGEERKSVTDTDLFTAGESTDSNPVPNAVTTDTPGVKHKAPTGALSTMVLPELRALANQVGVKGTSGMRKSELIAAIKEVRGQANGASATAAPEESGKSDTTTAEAPADTPVAQGGQNGSTTEAPRRERRGAARGAGSPTHTPEKQDREDSAAQKGGATPAAGKRQEGQQETKTDERGQDAGSDQSGDQQSSGGQQSRGDDEGDGRQGRRGRRFRDRDRRRRGERSGDGPDAVWREAGQLRSWAGDR